MSDYQLPEVWEAPSQMGGAWGSLNQPTAGARLAQDKVWDRAGIFLDVKEYKHLQAWTEKIANRPAVQRGLEVEYKEIDA